LALIGIFYRAFGKRYIFDHHDLSPELYLTRISDKQGLIYRMLIFCEGLSCRFANIIISTNESYKHVEVSRHSVDPSKIYIVRNNPIVSDCTQRGRGTRDSSQQRDKKVLIFLGSINPQDGVDVLLHVLHRLVVVYDRNDIMCRIVGGGDFLDSAKRLAKELNIAEYVEFTGMIMDREKIKEFLAQADIGVEPAPLSEANKYSTFIKVMEYMAASKPIVAFDLIETRYSANGSALLVEPGDYDGFARAIMQLVDSPLLREQLGRAGLERVENELNWEVAAAHLTEAYAALDLSADNV
jgi:glycosyltransferase involved in cell wall biosynthesis